MFYAKHRLAETTSDLAFSLVGYGFSSLGYVSVPLVLLALLEPSFRREGLSLIWPEDRERRFIAVMFWTPLLLVIPFAIATQARLSALWTMSALSLFGVVCLGSPRITVSRSTAATFATIAALVSVGALAASPLVAYARLKGGVENEALYTRPLAREIDLALKQERQLPPRFLVGTYPIANSVAFYMRDRPLPVALWMRVPALWSTSAAPDESVTVCLASDHDCRTNPLADPRASWRTITVEPVHFGISGAPETFVLEIKPRRKISPSDDEVADELSSMRRQGPARIP